MRLGNNQTDYQYKMGKNSLEETTSEKDLGNYIDNNLKLSDHVDAAENKANRLVGLIRAPRWGQPCSTVQGVSKITS